MQINGGNITSSTGPRVEKGAWAVLTDNAFGGWERERIHGNPLALNREGKRAEVCCPRTEALIQRVDIGKQLFDTGGRSGGLRS